jgi:hypothetical protein
MFVRKRSRTQLGTGRPQDRKPGRGGCGQVVNYYQALESYRENGRPGHRVVASWSARLGRDDPSLGAALAKAEGKLVRCRDRIGRCREALDDEGRMAVLFPHRGWRLSRRGVEEWLRDELRDESRLVRQIEGLRAAYAALGDWRAA